MKRFRNTARWAEEWYMALPLRIKCLYDYIYDNADNVGVWVPNWRLATFQIGEEVTEQDVTNKLSKKIERLPNGNFFIKDFCAEQWGILRPNKSRPHQSYVQLLANHQLADRVSIDYTYPSDRVKEKDKDKDKEKDKGKGVQGENQPPAANDQPAAVADQLLLDYERWTELVIEGNDPQFDQMLAREGLRPNGQLSHIARSHLHLLHRYPRKRPQSHVSFLHSLLMHLTEQLARGQPTRQKGQNTNSAEIIEPKRKFKGKL